MVKPRIVDKVTSEEIYASEMLRFIFCKSENVTWIYQFRAVPFKSVGGGRNGRFFEGGRGRILNYLTPLD